MKFFRTLAERIKHGYKIADDCYIAGGGRDELIVEFKGKKIRITYESLRGRPGMLIYPSKDRKWLPPHEHEAVSDADYDFIVKTVVENFEKHGETVEYPWTTVEPVLDMEAYFAEQERAGYRVERHPDGTTVVYPPPRRRLFSLETLRIGWSTWWRSWLPLLFGSGLMVVGIALLAPSREARMESLSAILGLVVILLGIAVNVALIFLLNRAGRIVAQRRYRVTVTRFIGWSLYWRMWLMIIALAIPAMVIIVSGAELLKLVLGASGHQALVIDVGSRVLDALIRLFLTVVACGWSLGRVLKKFAPTATRVSESKSADTRLK